MGNRAGWLIVTSALALSAGLAAGVILAPQEPPSTLGEDGAVDDVPVESRDFFDPRSVTVVPSMTAASSLNAPRAGTVTSVSCAVGQAWSSGETPISIDSVPVMTLHTDYPPWRDFTPGIQGADVSALQATLVSFGLPVEVDGRLGDDSLAQIDVLLASRGIENSGDGLALADFIWLSAPTATPMECLATPGQALGAGSPIASLGKAITSFRLQNPPSDLIPGDRTLTIGTTVVGVAADGSIADPADVSLLAATAEVKAHLTSDGQVPVAGAFSLREPLQVFAVPPSAVVATGSGSGCVYSGNSAVPVEIVASTLGRTLVRPVDSGELLSVRVGASLTDKQCE